MDLKELRVHLKTMYLCSIINLPKHLNKILRNPESYHYFASF